MCERCANIDYPIGDSIWLPCGGSPERYRHKPVKRGWSDEDERAEFIIARLKQAIERQRRENDALKAGMQRAAGGESFEGVA